MKLPQPLHSGILLKRYKRFLADIRLDTGEDITAHCANPGSMMGVAVEGAPVWVSEHRDGKRKLPWSWRLVDVNGVLIPIDTTNPNHIVAEALNDGAIPELAGYSSVRREVKYGTNSRIDFLLESAGKAPFYVEVKNVHLSRQPGLAEFPDSRTARGVKHLAELSTIRDQGHRAAMLFIVQRSDCQRFRAAGDLDPAYGDALKSAALNGVELLCYDCDVTPSEVVLRRAMEIDLE